MYALVIIAYNRPSYLERVLASVRSSLDYSNGNLDTFVFQDNAYNIWSQQQKTQDYLISRNTDLVRHALGKEVIMLSPINLGVALNFDRAERFIFLDRKYDGAIFLEDDMILHRYYISVMQDLLGQARNDTKVGMVACYGLQHSLTVVDQIAQKDSLDLLGHSWAFGLTRDAYLQRRPMVDKYVNLLRTSDYSFKEQFKENIHLLHNEMGFKGHVTSQDMMKAMATVHSGRVSLNTSVVLGQYIGATGLHSDLTSFTQQGYDKTVLYPDDGPFPQPRVVPEELDFLLNKQRNILNI